MNQSNHYSLASPTSLLLDDNQIIERGQEVRKQGAEHIMVIEEKLAWSMGKRNLEFMRIILAGHSKRLKASD